MVEATCQIYEGKKKALVFFEAGKRGEVVRHRSTGGRAKRP